MQKTATRIFIIASIIFGIIGILVVLTLPDNGDINSSAFNLLMKRLLFIDVFIILPSFALSVASKYLNGRFD